MYKYLILCLFLTAPEFMRAETTLPTVGKGNVHGTGVGALQAASVEKLEGTAVGKSHPATVPVAKQGRFIDLHESYLKRGKEGPIGVLFLGDSITYGWTSHTVVWNKYFGEYTPANFGIGGDRTQHILWRIENGELDGINPKVVVLMIGTNNSNNEDHAGIVSGVKLIVKNIHAKLPDTKVLLLGIFPRNHKRDMPANIPMQTVTKVNADIAKLDNGGNIRYLDINDKFLVDGTVPTEIMPDGVHLTQKGYEIWAEAIAPLLKEMMGQK